MTNILNRDAASVLIVWAVPALLLAWCLARWLAERTRGRRRHLAMLAHLTAAGIPRDALPADVTLWQRLVVDVGRLSRCFFFAGSAIGLLHGATWLVSFLRTPLAQLTVGGIGAAVIGGSLFCGLIWWWCAWAFTHAPKAYTAWSVLGLMAWIALVLYLATAPRGKSARVAPRRAPVGMPWPLSTREPPKAISTSQPRRRATVTVLTSRCALGLSTRSPAVITNSHRLVWSSGSRSGGASARESRSG